MPLLGCDLIEEKIVQHKAEKARKYQERYEKSRKERIEFGKNNPIVGNLGGVPIALPRYIVEYVQYDDTPDPFSKEWKTYKRPEKRTYADNLTAFGFVFDFKTNELRDPYANTYKRWEKETMHHTTSATHTWADVSLRSGKAAPKETMNHFANTMLRTNMISHKYHQLQDEYGLEKWKFPEHFVNKDTQKRDIDVYNFGNIFIAKDNNNNVVTLIKCGIKSPSCNHFYRLPDLNTELTLSYRCIYLSDWQRIQQMAENHLRSWIVETEHISQVQ